MTDSQFVSFKASSIGGRLRVDFFSLVTFFTYSRHGRSLIRAASGEDCISLSHGIFSTFVGVNVVLINTHLGSAFFDSVFGGCIHLSHQGVGDLHRREELHIAHDYVFCGFGSPHDPISTALFSDRLRWVVHRSGIVASLGSKRAVYILDAFA